VKCLYYVVLLITPFIVFAQNEEDLSEDEWDDIQYCIQKKMVQPIKNESDLLNLLNENASRDESQFLLLIEENYHQKVRDILKESIAKAVKNIPLITKKSEKLSAISWDLSYLFMAYFEEAYSKAYDFNNCIKSNQKLPVFNYFYFFENTEKVINKIRLKAGECCNEEDCEKYLTIAYLLKMAILKYEPFFVEYVEEKVLLEWNDVFEKEKLGLRNNEYLDEILGRE
jgi:hypothetical protein